MEKLEDRIQRSVNLDEKRLALLYSQTSLKLSIFFVWECRKQTTVLLVVVVSLSPINITDTLISLRLFRFSQYITYAQKFMWHPYL